MTIQPTGAEDPSRQAASLLSEGLTALVRSMTDHAAIAEAREDVAAVRAALDALNLKVERQAAEDRDQRRLLGDQLANLAGALDRLVTHLEGLSTLMAEMLERLSAPSGKPTAASMAEPAFVPGSEGVTVALAGVPGFQSLMDIQKALTTLSGVTSASVERYQEGDSRILVALRAPVTSSELVSAIRDGTGLAASVEEARPETNRLKLKISPASR